MRFDLEEIVETVGMVTSQHLDIRTVTLGVDLRSCSRTDMGKMCKAIEEKLMRTGEKLASTAAEVEARYGIPIVNKRMSVTPISIVAGACQDSDFTPIAAAMDRAAQNLGVDFIGGFSALVQKGFSESDKRLVNSIPSALATTSRVCSSVNVASTKAGINMDAILRMAEVIKESARLTADKDSIGCAKIVVFANAVEDNPFMAGAFHGVTEPECVLNVGISGPGVVMAELQDCQNMDFTEVYEHIKKIAFKITRCGELIGRETADRLGVPFGIVDISLAPTPEEADSVARILELIGVERVGAHGTIAALAMLNDAVKKGGAMATSHVGGLSGAFIPLSEDAGMVQAVREGVLGLPMLTAMTSVCSVGLDMVVVPGDTNASTLAGIIADEMAIGVINKKTTAVRIIPAEGKKAGEEVDYGGLLGASPVIPVSSAGCSLLTSRGGRIPAPILALNN